jgi:hypothetical protein
MTDFRCPDCGNYRDTPMHQLGCVIDPADPPTFSRPHPTLSQPWGDPDYDHSCEDCREGRHGRLAKPDPADPLSPLTILAALLHNFDPEWCRHEDGSALGECDARAKALLSAGVALASSPLTAKLSDVLKGDVRELAYLTKEDWQKRRGGDSIARTINAVFDIIDARFAADARFATLDAAPAGLDREAAARVLHGFCQSPEPIHSWRDHVYVTLAPAPAGLDVERLAEALYDVFAEGIDGEWGAGSFDKDLAAQEVIEAYARAATDSHD